MRTIKPELVEYIRTMIKGDYEANDKIESKLDVEGWEGMAPLMGATFFHLVDRYFGGELNDKKIIELVAAMRADQRAASHGIKAEGAETLIRAALDESVSIDIEPEAVGKIQALAVMKIAEAQPLSESELDALLTESVAMARRAD
jgi:hypothetical protein